MLRRSAVILAISVAALAVGARLWAQTRGAAVTQVNRTIWGQGNLSCSTWIAATARTAPDPDQISWTLGYISAVASAGTFLGPVTESEVRDRIGSYCAMHEGATIETATKVVVFELQQQVKRP